MSIDLSLLTGLPDSNMWKHTTCTYQNTGPIIWIFDLVLPPFQFQNFVFNTLGRLSWGNSDKHKSKIEHHRWGTKIEIRWWCSHRLLPFDVVDGRWRWLGPTAPTEPPGSLIVVGQSSVFPSLINIAFSFITAINPGIFSVVSGQHLQIRSGATHLTVRSHLASGREIRTG